MRIGIDIDDTIASTDSHLTPFLLEYDQTLRGNGIVRPTAYGFEQLDWTKEEINEFSRNNNDFAWTNIPVKEGVKEILKQWQENGHQIIFITARSQPYLMDPYGVSETWLIKNGIFFDKLIVNAKYKGPICLEENIDVFIDDSFGQCSFIAEHNKIPTLWYKESPHQSDLKGIIPVSSWQEIALEVEKIADTKEGE